MRSCSSRCHGSDDDDDPPTTFFRGSPVLALEDLAARQRAFSSKGVDALLFLSLTACSCCALFL